MKQTTLEPGLLPAFRLYMVVSVAALPFFLRLVGASFGINVAWDRYLLLILPVPLFLVLYTSVPWWQRRLGRPFLPVGLVLFSAQAIVEKYLTLGSLVAPPLRCGTV